MHVYTCFLCVSFVNACGQFRVSVQRLFWTYLTICVQGDLVSTIGESAALGVSGAVLWGASADYDDQVTSHRRAHWTAERHDWWQVVRPETVCSVRWYRNLLVSVTDWQYLSGTDGCWLCISISSFMAGKLRLDWWLWLSQGVFWKRPHQLNLSSYPTVR